jgi:hypothetical protein
VFRRGFRGERRPAGARRRTCAISKIRQGDVEAEPRYQAVTAIAPGSTQPPYVEALGHVDGALKLILTLPASTERDEWELALLSIEGTSRMALDGWDSPSASRIYGAARQVAERLGRPQELFRSVWGQWMGAHSNGQHVRAHALYQEIFDLLDKANEPEYVVQAHHAGGSQMVAEGVPSSPSELKDPTAPARARENH